MVLDFLYAVLTTYFQRNLYTLKVCSWKNFEKIYRILKQCIFKKKKRRVYSTILFVKKFRFIKNFYLRNYTGTFTRLTHFHQSVINKWRPKKIWLPVRFNKLNNLQNYIVYSLKGDLWLLQRSTKLFKQSYSWSFEISS